MSAGPVGAVDVGGQEGMEAFGVFTFGPILQIRVPSDSRLQCQRSVSFSCFQRLIR